MGLTKNISTIVDTNAARISDIKSRIQSITTSIAENRVKLDYLKKQYADLKNEASELGVENIADLPDVIAKMEGDLEDMLTQLNDTLTKAEAIING